MGFYSDTYDADMFAAGVSEETSQQKQRPDALCVSDALQRAKGALEGITVRILGEVSELSNKAGYKAVYFTVKDERSSLPCMMWTNRYKASGVELSIGALVYITGRFTLYAAKGRMNFDVFSIECAGEGNLRMQVANLAKKLKNEGLMDASRKRPLPSLPLTIGLVTSPRGAAVHDVLRTLRRRFPLARVLLAGVPVEGAGAPAALVAGVKCVEEAGAEVILLVRGGGSFEDLMPFNDEMLARAISATKVPVVTGIGHEPDTSIADMVADVRASTPTAAAEAVSTPVDELRAALLERGVRLGRRISHRIELADNKLSGYAQRPLFKDPMTLYAAEAQSLDFMHVRLQNALAGACKPYEQAMRVAAARLNDLSPLATIGRGYCMAHDANGVLVQSVQLVHEGDKLDVTFADGVAHCEVDSREAIRLSYFEMETDNAE